jgi:hypothetical protein
MQSFTIMRFEERICVPPTCTTVQLILYTPSPPIASMSLPPEPKGVGSSPAGEGVGESQFGRLEKKPSTLSVYFVGRGGPKSYDSTENSDTILPLRLFLSPHPPLL